MADERRGDPAVKSPRQNPGRFSMREISIDTKTGVRRTTMRKRTLRKAAPKEKKKKTSPSDAEREAVAQGRAKWNKRGSKALREESIGTKLRSFGRSLRRKVTGRKASRSSGR